MNVIFVGSSKPESINEFLLSIGSVVNYAGNTHQNALLEGLAELCNKLKVISCWTITPYPKVKKLLFGRLVMDCGKHKNNYVFTGVVNLPGINYISRFIRTRKEIKRALEKGEDNAVIVYEVHTPFLLAAATLRKEIKHIAVIVPDLPEFMIAHKNPFRYVAKKIDHKIIDWCLKRSDSYVLLSEQMQERLPMKGKKWSLVEGVFHEKIERGAVEKSPYKTIMYTGILHREKGIENLINAFSQIKDENYRLWIRGYGDYADEIVRISKQDKRITYLDPMPHAELVKLEQKATVMVNPTQPTLSFTKYFFPSKTMEYLASGTPTVMYKLPCMPPEYDEYIYYVNGESTEALRDKLIEVCEKPQSELNEFGAKASEFVLTKKNPIKQCENILSLIENR